MARPKKGVVPPQLKGHQFTKGHHPGGRPKKSKEYNEFKKFAYLLSGDPKFQQVVKKKALEGDSSAVKTILNYGVGKPKEEVALKGNITIGWKK